MRAQRAGHDVVTVVELDAGAVVIGVHVGAVVVVVPATVVTVVLVVPGTVLVVVEVVGTVDVVIADGTVVVVGQVGSVVVVGAVVVVVGGVVPARVRWKVWEAVPPLPVRASLNVSTTGLAWFDFHIFMYCVSEVVQGLGLWLQVGPGVTEPLTISSWQC